MLRPWWAQGALAATADGLSIEGVPVADLARRHGTPVYLYSLAEVGRQVAGLRDALRSTGAPFRIHYAMKANRFAPVLRAVREHGDVGIDACSPREVAQALGAGFAPGEISVTTSMASNRDLDAFAQAGVHVNLDSFSALRRYAARVPRGTRVGLRLDPAIVAGYGDTKFGFAHQDFDRALRAAETAGLRVSALHVHCGWGLQMEALPQLEWLYGRLAEFASRAPSVDTVNVGGGLGVRRRDADRPVALSAWADALRRILAPLGRTLACEPGTLLVDTAGLLVAEVNTVEEKAGRTWAGIDTGHNTYVYVAHYALPVELVHVTRPLDPPTHRYAVAGNVNESNDVFDQERALPELREGDLLALLPAGAYGSSMASDHCLRGGVVEVAV
jgi:diaminopimelate decarboxylase